MPVYKIQDGRAHKTPPKGIDKDKSGCRKPEIVGAGAQACLAGLMLAGCDNKPASHSYSGGVVDGWPVWGHGGMGQRYSANTQITPENVKDLKVAWTYRTGDLSGPGKRADLAFEATPILANNTLYLCSPRSRIAALDPDYGQAEMDVRRPSRHQSRHRHHLPRRVLLAGQPDGGRRLFQAHLRRHHRRQDVGAGRRHGRPCGALAITARSICTKGWAYRKARSVGHSSAPTIVGDKVITGSKIIDFHNTDMPGGVVRALDARTGKMVWAFTAAPPDPAAGRRPALSAQRPQCVGADVGRHGRKLIFLPTGTPQVDSYIGKTDWDYYGSSVIALNTDTGQVVWHYQLVHKDIWDYDSPSQPLLFDYKAPDGSTKPALAQATKMGYIFVFNRVTGQPMFPMHETPVSTGGVQKGLSPTQPIPELPEHEVRITKTQELRYLRLHLLDREACLKRFHALNNEGIFTPTIPSPAWTIPPVLAAWTGAGSPMIPSATSWWSTPATSWARITWRRTRDRTVIRR